jgi:exodeoxyribonuclease VII large subunit
MHITFTKEPLNQSQQSLLVITSESQENTQHINELIDSQFMSPEIENNKFGFNPTMETLELMYQFFMDKGYEINLTSSMAAALNKRNALNKPQSVPEPKKPSYDTSGIKRKVKKTEGSEESLLPASDTPTEAPQKDTVTLSRLFSKVTQVINGAFQHSLWLQCEIANFNHVSKGHIYLDLIETDGNGNEIAKNKAIIWSNLSNRLLEKFQQGTGSQLQAGQKVLFLVDVAFDSRFGLNLNIKDVDPNFTLGDMEAKINKIRQQLKDENLYYINKKKDLPFIFEKIAVISPNDAAGLKDFQIEADKLVNNNICQFDYYPAIFQGRETSKSVQKAIENVKNSGEKYDALVVIRGGGAKTDLHYLNDFDIAKMLTSVTMPVVVGIGHQIDHGILDEVSTVTQDTPSKVIGYIFNHILSVYQNYEKQHEQVQYALIDIISQTETNLSNGFNKIKNIVFESVNQYEIQLEKIHVNNRHALSTLLTNVENQITLMNNQNRESMVMTLDKTEQWLTQHYTAIIKNMEFSLYDIEKDIEKNFSVIQQFNPKQLFKKGFAVALNERQEPIKNCDSIHIDDRINIYIHDGVIETKVDKILKNQ